MASLGRGAQERYENERLTRLDSPRAKALLFLERNGTVALSMWTRSVWPANHLSRQSHERNRAHGKSQSSAASKLGARYFEQMRIMGLVERPADGMIRITDYGRSELERLRELRKDQIAKEQPKLAP